MIASLHKTDTFDPVALSLLFETQEQIDKFYGIFNTAYLIDAVDYDTESAEIRRVLTPVHDVVQADVYHNKLQEAKLNP